MRFSAYANTNNWIGIHCFISTSETSLVNKRDLQALTIAGPTVTRPVPDLLAVLSLNNRLCIMKYRQ